MLNTLLVNPLAPDCYLCSNSSQGCPLALVQKHSRLARRRGHYLEGQNTRARMNCTRSFPPGTARLVYSLLPPKPDEPSSPQSSAGKVENICRSSLHTYSLRRQERNGNSPLLTRASSDKQPPSCHRSPRDVACFSLSRTLLHWLCSLRSVYYKGHICDWNTNSSSALPTDCQVPVLQGHLPPTSTAGSHISLNGRGFSLAQH